MGGILGLILFVIDIWAIVQIIKSKATDMQKIIWVLVVVILPLLGLIAWYFAGPKK